MLQAGGLGVEHVQEVALAVLGDDRRPGHGRAPTNIPEEMNKE